MSGLDEFKKAFKAMNKFDQENGLEFEIHKPGEITYHLTIQEKHLSSPGVSHGAVIAGFMDCVLGLSALSLAITKDNLTSTVEFKLNFLKPAKLGDRLTGKGKIEHAGKSLIMSSGEVYNQETGDLVAKGLGTFNLYPLSKKKELMDQLS